MNETKKVAAKISREHPSLSLVDANTIGLLRSQIKLLKQAGNSADKTLVIIENHLDQIPFFKSDDPKLYFSVGLKFKNEKLFDLAISNFNQAIELDPQFASAFYERGNTYFDQQQFEAAIASYDQAVATDPQFAPAYLNKGIGQENLGRPELAIQSYEQVIKLDPQEMRAHIYRANALHKLGRHQEAIESFDQAILIAPQDSGL